LHRIDTIAETPRNSFIAEPDILELKGWLFETICEVEFCLILG